MKKAPALITVAIIILIVAGAVYVSRKSASSAATAWQLVPSHASAVFETTKPEALQKLKTDTTGVIGFIIARGKSKTFTEPYLFAFQSIGKETRWVAILPRAFPTLLDSLEKQKITARNRTYQNKPLYDLSRGETPWASAANIDGIWIISTHAILVEEVIRQNQKRDYNFRTLNRRLFELPDVKQDDGNLYIQKLSPVPGSPPNGQLQKFLTDLCHSLILDTRWEGQNLLTNGFAVDTTGGSPTLLAAFRDQSPVKLDLRRLIPEEVRTVVHFGFSNPSAWYSKQKVSGFRKPDPYVDLEAFGFSMDEFAKAVDNEMAYCQLPGERQVVLIELKEITKSKAQLERIRTGLSSDGLSLRENHADRTVVTLKKPNVLGALLWPLQLSFAETSYAFDGNILLIAPDAETLERVIDIRDDERTMGRSIAWRKFLETTLDEANVSFLMNNREGNPESHVFGFPSFADMEKVSLQFYTLEGNYYSSGSILLSNEKPMIAARTRERHVALSGHALLRPWLVRNYAEKQNEVLVQDAANALQLLDESGKPRWTRDVGDLITTEVREMDFLKNGKFQYLFCTPGKIHLVDRLGNYVKGFPKDIPVKQPRWMSVVDYDNTRNYRILVSEESGNIFILNKEGKPLEGWSPKLMERGLAQAPRYLRIRQKDYFMAVTLGGDLHLFNRRGESVAGYPVQTKVLPAGEISCDGKQISLISESGQLMKFDQQGKVVFEEPVMKNVTAAKFRIAEDADERDFVVTRTERGNLAVFDSSGKQLWEIVNPLSDKIEPQYHKVSEGKWILVVRDTEQNLLYAVDMTGKMLFAQPVQASQPPALDYDRDSQTVKLFVVNDEQIEIMKVTF